MRSLLGGARRWNSAMLAQAADGARRGTRLKRAMLLLVPALGATGGLGLSIFTGALAAGVNLTDQPFTLYSNGVVGNGVAGVVDNPAIEGSDGTTNTNTGMVSLGFSSALLDGLCGIVNSGISVGSSTFYLELSSGTVNATNTSNFSATNTSGYINAANLYMQAPSVSATGTSNLTNAILGESADKVNIAGSSLPGETNGAFGLDATSGAVSLQGLTANAYEANISGSLSLPGLSIKVVPASSTPTTCS